MPNRSKAKGTAFETLCRDWLAERLGDPRIERRALHGSRDMGDLYGLVAHGCATGIVECKCHATVTPSLVESWQGQTEAERGNADADFAVLLIKTPGVGARSLGRTRARLTLRSLLAVAGLAYEVGAASEGALDSWVESDLETVCALMEGGAEL